MSCRKMQVSRAPVISELNNKGSYMNASGLLNLFSELRKRGKKRGMSINSIIQELNF